MPSLLIADCYSSDNRQPIPDNYYNTFEKYCKGFAPIFEVWYNYESDKTLLFSYKYHTKNVACILTAKQAQVDIRKGTRYFSKPT